MCIFCDIVEGKIPTNKVYEDDVCLAFLDLAQMTKGHTLVIPKQHYKNILDIDEETLQHLIVVTQKLAKQITTNLNADGVNIYHNGNEVAGQEVDHFHFHIIPRYQKDELKVIHQDHEDYDLSSILKEIVG